MDKQGNLSKVRELIREINRLDLQRWQELGFSTYRWWLLLALLIFPWVIWAKAADRRKIPESLLVGALVVVFVSNLDTAGVFLHFWDYPVETIPLVPGAWAFDFSVIPVAYMFLHQYFRTWRPYLCALLVMALIYSFVGEPLSNRMDLVVYYRWKPVYSFFLYIALGVGIRLFIGKLKRLTARDELL